MLTKDNIIQWKYTLLLLDSMIDQIMQTGNGLQLTEESRKGEIDFVKISETLPKLAISQQITVGLTESQKGRSKDVKK
jgi:hypothetical protein